MCLEKLWCFQFFAFRGDFFYNSLGQRKESWCQAQNSTPQAGCSCKQWVEKCSRIKQVSKKSEDAKSKTTASRSEKDFYVRNLKPRIVKVSVGLREWASSAGRTPRNTHVCILDSSLSEGTFHMRYEARSDNNPRSKALLPNLTINQSRNLPFSVRIE